MSDTDRDIHPDDMTLEQAHEEAVRRIEATAQSGQDWLDLVNLPLEAIPTEIALLARQLRKISLGITKRRKYTEEEWRARPTRQKNYRGLRDLRPLQNFIALQSISLINCFEFEDLAPLQGLATIDSISLINCHSLKDLTPLQGLKGLQSLNLRKCFQLSDLVPLEVLRGLNSLDLSGCSALTDIAPLQTLKSLKSLYLNNCLYLADITPLQGLTSLKLINLSYCDITELTPLNKISSLQSLDLSGNDSLTDITPLQDLSLLQSLILQHCDQLTEIRSLQGLTSLQTLDLSGCSQLTNLPPLQELTALQTLDLSGCSQLTNLPPLQELTALQTLDLSGCSQLTNLPPLQELTALQTLDLSYCSQLTNLPPLQGLTALQTLDLSYCSQLTNLPPLRGLTALQTLRLINCTQMVKITSLQGLTELEHLDMSGCDRLICLPPLQGLNALRTIDLRDCKELTELGPMKDLRALFSIDLSGCKTLTRISSIEGLSNLNSIDLSGCEQLTRLPSLQGLTSLNLVNLRHCKGLIDLKPLLACINLKHLDITGSGCEGRQSPRELLLNLPQLQWLECTQLSRTPPEVLTQKGEFFSANCLPRLRAWLADLEQGEAESHDLKLFFLGNGRVGKSELFGRLRGEAFHGKRETTHGIQLGRFELGKHSDGKPIFCNAWDFGGQDIYLGTHALFLKSRALFVLAWHPEMETDAPYTEAVSGLEMRHRPLRYWLDYIHALAGEEARVIVVQTQCATQHDKRRPDLDNTSRFAWIETTVSCAEQDDGVDALRVLLKQAAKHRLEQPAPPRMPASWLAVRDRLIALRATEKTIDRKRFYALCAETHHGASSAALLHYLHQAGDVFHQDDVFDGAIVLDQQWALDGIYAIFQRDKVLKRLRRQRGRVHADDFDLMVWHDRYSQQEQSLLLSMMQRCDLIFRLRGNDDDAQYAMMDALPPADDDTAALPECWRPGPRYGATLHYDFLHEGILRAWIAGIGREANAKAQYWRYGTEFHDTNTRSDAWMQADMLPDGSGRIALLTQGAQAEVLRERLIERFAEIRIGQPPTVEREDPPRASPVHVRRSDEEASGQIVVGPRPRNPGDKPEVYISYAWGGADRPELMAFADAMHDALQDVFTVYRDKSSMPPGDSIAEFMERIGRGARVLIVLSRPYLNSRYCMQELEHLHARHFGNREQMRRCIRPLVIDPTLRLDDDDIADYTDYWIGKVARLESRLAGKTADQHLILRHRLNRYRRIAGATDEMLEFLGDMVMPRGEKELSENRFSMVKESLLALPGA